MSDTSKTLQLDLVSTLENIGSKKCLKRANLLKSILMPLRSINLRDLDLLPYDVMQISNLLTQNSEINLGTIQSISFSYNQELGDKGVKILMEKMPESVIELGLVNCGIMDPGGRAILKWMNKSERLRMVCIEQNKFSEELTEEFKLYRKRNPQVTFMY